MTELFDEHDQAASERRLDDAHAQRAAADLLSELLVRAAAPGRPEELAGADTVLAAFRAAYPAPAAQPRRTLRRALMLKVAALVAAFAVGGVAFATGTGVLPNPFPIGPGSDPADPPSAAHSSHGATPAPSGSVVPSSGVSPSALAAGSLPPNANGLCRSYLASSDKDKPKATEDPEYAALIAAATAAGQDLITFCQALVDAKGNPGGTGPSGAPTASPTLSPSPNGVQPSKGHPTKSPKVNGVAGRASQSPRAPGRGQLAHGSATPVG